MVGVAFICCTFVAKIKYHSSTMVAYLGYSKIYFWLQKKVLFCFTKLKLILWFDSTSKKKYLFLF